jgi:hypothetical protein
VHGNGEAEATSEEVGWVVAVDELAAGRFYGILDLQVGLGFGIGFGFGEVVRMNW